MTRTAWIIEYRDLDPVAVHLVPRPGHGEPGFYREAVSVQAFIDRNVTFVADRIMGGHAPKYAHTRHFHVCPSEDYFYRDLQFEARAFGPNQGPVAHAPRSAYRSLAEFYEAIGYRPKTRTIHYWQQTVNKGETNDT